jgi:hypothetical protein
MTTGVRRKISNYLRAEIEATKRFDGVVDTWPESPQPSNISNNGVHILRLRDTLAPLTATQVTGDLLFAVLIFVKSMKGIEALKCDHQDYVEAALWAANGDADFAAAGGTQLKVINADTGALALAPLGYQSGTFPPFGIVRLDVEVTIDYIAI